MSFVVEPELGREQPVFINRYPASQAALARISEHQGYEVAHRFELYINGLELCNGYWELTDPADQRARFAADNRLRRASGKPEMAIDDAFLAALDNGLPDCAGVALGLDRLLMLKLGSTDIRDVLAFPIERA
jgi:lysyl-tRNA synthetase class 2